MPDATAHRKTTPLAWAGQVLLYAAFAAAIGAFSRWPTYRHLAPNEALIKLSFTHAGKPVGDCRPMTDAERVRLPPNVRAPLICPRERSPVKVEVDIDGRPTVRRSATPSGLSRDGASAVYQRIVVPAGPQRIAVRLADDARASGFAWQRDVTVTLAPAQILVIDFDAEKGGITFQ